MRKKTIFVCLLLLICRVESFAQTNSADAQTQSAATIEAVVSQVKEGLTRVQKDLKGKHLPQLKSVTLTLNTVAQKQGGVSVKLWVITLGGKHESDETQEVAVTLTPPSPNNPTKVGAVSLSEALETAIASAAEGLQNVGTGEYPLKFSGLTVTIAFAVKNSGEGGANITLLPIGFGLTGSVSRNQSQTIKVVFDDSLTK